MDAVEEMAVSEPLNAKVLTLRTNANENPLSGKFEALGWERPKVCYYFLFWGGELMRDRFRMRIGILGGAMRLLVARRRCGVGLIVRGESGGVRRFI